VSVLTWTPGALPVERCGSQDGAIHKRLGRAVEAQQRDGVSSGRGTRPESVVERQAVAANRGAEMAGGERLRQQIDEFAIVRGRDHHMSCGAVAAGDEFAQHRVPCGDPFHRIRAPEELVEQQ
jgi:hypothetical protein